MDRFTQMQAYVAVVDNGSFTDAAEQLGLSKAAVSRHVDGLESRLGVRLLHRTTRRLSLTDEGTAFLTRSRELLANLEEAESEVSARADSARGMLRINAPVTFGIRHLAPLWGRFREMHPHVQLDITLSDRIADLVEEGYDLAVRIAPLNDSSLIGRPLANTRMVLCASPAYLQRRGVPEHPRDLRQHDVIGYRYWPEHDAWRFAGPDGVVVVQTRPVVQSNSGDTCRALALDDQGIILQPSFLVGDDLTSGSLIELLPDFDAGRIGIHAVYPSRKHVPAKLRAIIQFLQQQLAMRQL